MKLKRKHILIRRLDVTLQPVTETWDHLGFKISSSLHAQLFEIKLTLVDHTIINDISFKLNEIIK